jgi:uncharacterized membrane protein YdbT with pleckstrin-like domain
MSCICAEKNPVAERANRVKPLTCWRIPELDCQEVGVGFPESVLTKDEQVVLHLHPHWKALIRPIFVVAVAIAAVVLAAIFLPAAGWSTVLLYVVGALALVAVAWLAFWPWLVWRTTHYVFTNERVILRTGVFSRNGRDIPLGRVNDVSFSHGVIDRLLGCGTLTIESAGERGQVVLTDIPRVEKTQSELYELVEADHAKHTFDDDDREAIVRSVKEER